MGVLLFQNAGNCSSDAPLITTSHLFLGSSADWRTRNPQVETKTFQYCCCSVTLHQLEREIIFTPTKQGQVRATCCIFLQFSFRFDHLSKLRQAPRRCHRWCATPLHICPPKTPQNISIHACFTVFWSHVYVFWCYFLVKCIFSLATPSAWYGVVFVNIFCSVLFWWHLKLMLV